MKFLKKIGSQFLDVKVSSIKNSEKKKSKSPTKNIELNNWSIERWTNNSYFTGPSVCSIHYKKETWPYMLLEHILIFNFEEIWAWLAMSN